ncbi:hypothetical protein AK812_SmicGene41707 [Symbiodinium microadriaticum]|uniref:Uncharacterized protein n=1 Tax=Symbiodinium microadriaticum TaxID=2951 RepID=A0A1Q9C5F5_SYMMI|nr:hypothetical protein AK812_SmicGene41707 [Symbiodinium microadriaticum]
MDSKAQIMRKSLDGQLQCTSSVSKMKDAPASRGLLLTRVFVDGYTWQGKPHPLAAQHTNCCFTCQYHIQLVLCPRLEVSSPGARLSAELVACYRWLPEASSEPEEDPVGEPGPVIPSAVAKTGVPPPPPPPMHHGGDGSTMEAAPAKASPIPATVGPRPRPHLAPMRSGPPAPSPATPAGDFLSSPGASDGVHIFVPGPRAPALSTSSFSWRRIMSGASDSSGAFDSSDIEREHLSTLDEQGRRLYLAAREDRLRRAEMGEVFGPPPPVPVGGTSTAASATVLSASPVTARRRSRTPPRVTRRSRRGGTEAELSSHRPTTEASAAGSEGMPPVPSCTYHVEIPITNSGAESGTNVLPWEQGMPTDAELEHAAELAEIFHGWKEAVQPGAPATVATREEPSRSRSPRRATMADVAPGAVPGSLAATLPVPDALPVSDAGESRIGNATGTFILEPAQDATGVVNIVLTLRLLASS